MGEDTAMQATGRRLGRITGKIEDLVMQVRCLHLEEQSQDDMDENVESNLRYAQRELRAALAEIAEATARVNELGRT